MPEALSDSFEFIGAIEISSSIYLSIYAFRPTVLFRNLHNGGVWWLKFYVHYYHEVVSPRSPPGASPPDPMGASVPQTPKFCSTPRKKSLSTPPVLRQFVRCERTLRRVLRTRELSSVQLSRCEQAFTAACVAHGVFVRGRRGQTARSTAHYTTTTTTMATHGVPAACVGCVRPTVLPMEKSQLHKIPPFPFPPPSPSPGHILRNFSGCTFSKVHV